ncbi:hypothetical protein RF638_15460 [Kocuria sp. CPCC 205235]
MARRRAPRKMPKVATEDRIVLEEQEIEERGGGLFDDIPECKDGETRTWPKLEAARARAKRGQAPTSLLKQIRKR